MIRFTVTSLCSLLLLLPTLASAQAANLIAQVSPGPGLGDWESVEERGGRLVTVAGAAPRQVGPGDLIAPREAVTESPIVIRNLGQVAAGEFEFRVYLSGDKTAAIGGRDRLIHTDRISLGCPAPNCPAGSEIWRAERSRSLGSYPIRLPRDLNTENVGVSPYVKVELDPANEVFESDEKNIFVSANSLSLVGANIVAGDNGMNTIMVVENDPPAPSPEEIECYFGEELLVSYQLCNRGERPIKGFVNKVIISSDTEFSNPTPFYDKTDTAIEVHPMACVTAEEGLACATSGGACVDGICHKFCSDKVNHSDCPADLFCDDDLLLPYSAQPTCQNKLRAGGCYTYTQRPVTVPTVDAKGRPFAEGPYYFGANINSEATNKVPETNVRDNSTVAQMNPIMCRYPRADFAPVALDAPLRMAAGETATVVRRIDNLGILEEEATYRYVLSTNDFPSLDDILLPVESSTNGSGRTTIGRKGRSENTDLIRVPSTVLPGEYYLGIIVDGADAVDELDERNNTFVAANRVVIEPSALRVITRFLPHATRGATYSHQLVAAGGIDTNRWSARGLPPGFTFSADGLLSGTPRTVGDYAVTFDVKSGDVSATTMLGIRVLPPMGALAITTQTLPPAVLATPYFAHIAAQGGEPFFDAATGKASYRCRRVSGGLPDGILDVSENCDITGSAQRIHDVVSEFTVEVSDKSGNRAQRTFTLPVVKKSELFIETQRLDEGAAGEPYGVDCATYPSMTARGAPDGHNYVWSLEETSEMRKPLGLEFSTRVNNQGRNVGCLTGTPRECGSFLVPVRVTAVPDGVDTPRPEHDSDTAILPMNVICMSAGLGNTDLPGRERGQSLDHQLEIQAGEGGRVSLFAGQLPPGITMTEDGRISGTVAEDAPVGTYNFLVEVEDDVGGGALVPLSIEVLPTPGDPPPPVKPKDGCGSSATGGGVSGALPFAVVLLGLVAAVLRRRAAAFVRITSVVAVVGLAGSAQAQFQSGYQVTAPLPMAYEDLPANGTVRAATSLSDIDWDTSSHMWKVALPNGFDFRYFGRSFGYLGISGNGSIIPYTVLNPSPSTSTAYYVGSTNASFPTAGGPAGIIAPWWDDFARSGSYSRPGGLYTRVEGEPGSRVFKVQWKNLTHHSCTASSCAQARSYSFQTWIFEAEPGLDSTIVFSYGTPIGPGNVPGAGTPSGYTGTLASSMPSGSVGMESVDEDKGITVLSCTPNCNFDAHFPTEKAVVITQKADLRMAAVSGPATGWGGVPVRLQGTVQNIGRTATGPFTVEFFGSTDAVLDGSDVALGSSAPIANLAMGSSANFSGEVTLPRNLAPGSYYVIARADVAGAVNEDFLANNIGVHGPFVINDAAPDATVESIELPASAATGSTFTLDWTVRNVGNAPIVGMAYDVYLSTNEMISPSDRKVGSGVVDVDLLSTAPARVELTLPADVRPGRYHLGVILDPANEFAEVSKQNNAVASSATFPVVGGALQIAVEELAPAQLGSSYCVELTATGGDGNYTFRVAEGSVLPPGLALVQESPASTLICGVPAQAGAFSFALEVTSAGETVGATVALVIHGTTAPLTIASVELPGAIYNTPYAAQLLAVGGQAPYSWSLVGGALPQGLGLSVAGKLNGAATSAGTFSISVQVKDAAGDVALQTLGIRVSEPSRVTCLTTRLAPAPVGKRLDVALLAAGGSEPYTWTAIEARRLAQGADRGETLSDASPPGIALSRDGVVTGTPSAAGSYLWTVEVQDASARERCIVMLDVVYEQGLTVVTRGLADAVVDVPYEVQLEASGGGGNLQWRLAPGSSLPNGLGLDESGQITGVARAALLGEDESRTFNFAVEVQDGQNRVGMGALSIKVRRPLPEPPSAGGGDGGGCQAGAGAPGLVGMALALGFALLRRRD